MVVQCLYEEQSVPLYVVCGVVFCTYTSNQIYTRTTSLYAWLQLIGCYHSLYIDCMYNA